MEEGEGEGGGGEERGGVWHDMNSYESLKCNYGAAGCGLVLSSMRGIAVPSLVWALGGMPAILMSTHDFCKMIPSTDLLNYCPQLFSSL